MGIKSILAVGCLLAASSVLAGTQSGIELYPGAKADAAVARMMKATMNLDVMTYRTTDSAEKVAAFYRKQHLQELGGTTKEGAVFTGKGTSVSIQNPWADMMTGKLTSDTLISISTK